MDNASNLSNGRGEEPVVSARVREAMIRAGLSQPDALEVEPTPAPMVTVLAPAVPSVTATPPVNQTQRTPEMVVETTPQKKNENIQEPVKFSGTFFDVAYTVLFCIAAATALTIFYPPTLGDIFNVFATPVKVLPEWYMLPAFGVVLAAPAKIIGLALMSGVVGLLFVLPFLPKLENSIPFGTWVFRALFAVLHVGVAALGYSSMHH
jgi:quinol-cytochrome oxidoreductase complex cytochrome b subunit